MDVSHDTWGAKFVRGMVKTVFITCYIAFMWASIHHVATYFNNFEAGRGDLPGSYALAGAFDITALVTTIGVMFFRKSMPNWVLFIVWMFILAIAGYSFFINWEYSSHYQNMDLIMQPTGNTVPVYDVHGLLHYVPEMKANTGLLWINPILASGFTVFSLVYSVIAEFFGTKPPTASELLAKKKYLEETSSILQEIQTLEEKQKKPSIIQRTKETLKEAKAAANEVLAPEKEQPETVPKMEVPLPETSSEETPDKLQVAFDFLQRNPRATDAELAEHLELKRPASARFWRIKAMEFFAENGTLLVSATEQLDDEIRNFDGTPQYLQPDSFEDGNLGKNVIESGEEIGLDHGMTTDPIVEAVDVRQFHSVGTESAHESSISRMSTMRFTRRKPMTILEVAEVLGCTDRHVRNLRSSGKLLPDESDPKNLITAGSVKTYVENRTRKVSVS